MNPCRSSWLFWLHGLNGAPMFGPPSGTRVPLFVQAVATSSAATEIKRPEIILLGARCSVNSGVWSTSRGSIHGNRSAPSARDMAALDFSKVDGDERRTSPNMGTRRRARVHVDINRVLRRSWIRSGERYTSCGQWVGRARVAQASRVEGTWYQRSIHQAADWLQANGARRCRADSCGERRRIDGRARASRAPRSHRRRRAVDCAARRSRARA